MTFPFQPKPGPPPGHRPAAESWPAQDGPEAEQTWAGGEPESDAPGDESQSWAGDQPVPDPAPATGHPAVDAVLRSLANAAQLPPAEQIAEYEAAHQVLQETLASIDG